MFAPATAGKRPPPLRCKPELERRWRRDGACRFSNGSAFAEPTRRSADVPDRAKLAAGRLAERCGTTAPP